MNGNFNWQFRRSKYKFPKKKLFPSAFLMIMVIASACQKTTGYQRMEGMIWNTSYHISYKGSAELQDSVLPVLNEVSRSLSVFDPNSLLSHLNGSDSIVADDHFKKVYDTSLEINKLSRGNFDPTVSPLITAWGFGIGHEVNADTLAVDSVLQFVGIEKTRREGNIIFKNDIRTQFNFSAIAKGYGCDAVGEMFRRNRVADYMIEIGGEIALSGESPSGRDWRISIDAPIEDLTPQHKSALVIGITDAGIATSGNYRNFRKEGANTYAHTISPVSGRPYVNGILSATVIAPTCMEADALATACMASPLDLAKEIIMNYKAEGFLILADTVWMSPGFEKYIISESSEPGSKDRN